MLTFHDLYSTYSHDVYRFAYWLVGDPAEAEDITSETFVRAWVKFDAIGTETLKAVLKCDRCGGRMRILCAINPPGAIQKILDCLGLPSKPPPISPAVLGRYSDEFPY